MERLKLNSRKAGNYFTQPDENIEFISSGCKILDLALGNGWAEDKVINIVGDKSTGKTLLAIEAASQFVRKHPNGLVHYRDCEAAFIPSYAKALGMPVDQVNFGGALETVEDLYEDLRLVMKKSNKPKLYIVDSLDALSDSAEMDRNFEQSTYATGKAKNLSKMFRLLARPMVGSQLTLVIVSQVRDKIGFSRGRQTTRSGGRALDFYASQVLYLQHLKTLPKSIHGITRPVGIRIRAKVDKNKVALPLREAEFSIMFGYGIDDREACTEWLKISKCNTPGYDKLPTKLLHRLVAERWYEIENSFLPKQSKYQDDSL